MKTKLDFALEHAERGWRVLPLHNPVPGRGCSCRKKDACPSIGKHPRIPDWTNKATTDASTIRGWWRQWPDANIGIATGAVSGNFVLDVDDKNDFQGSETLARLEQQYGELPVTPVSKTGTGRHYHFQHPGFALNNRVGKAGVGAGLDIRADAGLVVAPGSIHATGAEYEWFIDDVPLAPAPQWLIDRIQGNGSILSPDAPVIAAPTSGALALIPEGERNTGLFLAASSMRGSGMEQTEIENRLLEMNAIQCATPLPVAEVKGIAKNVVTRYVPGKRPAATIGVLRGKDKLIWMKVVPADILGHRWLSMLPPYQFGWRMRLVLESWRSGGCLPNDSRVLSMLARENSLQLFESEMHCVLYDFEPVDVDGEPMLLNREVAELFVEQMALYKQRCEASAKAKEAKEAKKRNEEAGNGGQPN